MTTCPHCGQDEATDHTRCRAYMDDAVTLRIELGRVHADHRLADAAQYVLASAPPDRRLTIALAVVEAWTGDDDADPS